MNKLRAARVSRSVYALLLLLFIGSNGFVLFGASIFDLWPKRLRLFQRGKTEAGIYWRNVAYADLIVVCHLQRSFSPKELTQLPSANPVVIKVKPIETLFSIFDTNAVLAENLVVTIPTECQEDFQWVRSSMCILFLDAELLEPDLKIGHKNKQVLKKFRLLSYADHRVLPGAMAPVIWNATEKRERKIRGDLATMDDILSRQKIESATNQLERVNEMLAAPVLKLERTRENLALIPAFIARLSISPARAPTRMTRGINGVEREVYNEAELADAVISELTGEIAAGAFLTHSSYSLKKAERAWKAWWHYNQNEDELSPLAKRK